MTRIFLSFIFLCSSALLSMNDYSEEQYKNASFKLRELYEDILTQFDDEYLTIKELLNIESNETEKFKSLSISYLQSKNANFSRKDFDIVASRESLINNSIYFVQYCELLKDLDDIFALELDFSKQEITWKEKYKRTLNIVEQMQKIMNTIIGYLEKIINKTRKTYNNALFVYHDKVLYSLVNTLFENAKKDTQNLFTQKNKKNNKKKSKVKKKLATKNTDSKNDKEKSGQEAEHNTQNSSENEKTTESNNNNTENTNELPEYIVENEIQFREINFSVLSLAKKKLSTNSITGWEKELGRSLSYEEILKLASINNFKEQNEIVNSFTKDNSLASSSKTDITNNDKIILNKAYFDFIVDFFSPKIKQKFKQVELDNFLIKGLNAKIINCSGSKRRVELFLRTNMNGKILEFLDINTYEQHKKGTIKIKEKDIIKKISFSIEVPHSGMKKCGDDIYPTLHSIDLERLKTYGIIPEIFQSK
jgi:hypothetical protein